MDFNPWGQTESDPTKFENQIRIRKYFFKTGYDLISKTGSGSDQNIRIRLDPPPWLEGMVREGTQPGISTPPSAHRARRWRLAMSWREAGQLISTWPEENQSSTQKNVLCLPTRHIIGFN